MGGVSPETCWASHKYEIKFWYTVATCWIFYVNYTSNNLPRMQNQRLRCSFRLLMMGGVSPETCWDSHKYEIKFWYTVASCWIFYVNYASSNLPRMQNQRLQCSFRLLMMGGVSPETCWASHKYEIKFWYTVASCWIFYVNYTSNNLARMQNQRLQCSFRLLMMGGVSPETCWASHKYEIKFWYTVASCWIFYVNCTSNNLPRMQNQRLQCSFRLLMMGGVSPETCWASHKYEIKFWYTVASCWIFYVNYTSNNLPRMQNQRLQCSFRLLMMGGVSLETCWASYKYEIKFWYTVASCWIFYVNYTVMHGSTNINFIAHVDWTFPQRIYTILSEIPHITENKRVQKKLFVI